MRCDIRMELSDEGAESRPASSTGEGLTGFVAMTAGAWTLNASLATFTSYRKCSKRRISGHSAQATSRLRINGMTKSSRTARGSVFGSSSGFAAEVNAKPGFGFRVNDAFRSRSEQLSASICKSVRIPV
jgi:hypothetical protein